MKSIIFGIASTYLTQEEKEFFSQIQPLGFILFARNIETPDQVKRLTKELREVVDHDYVPILIDQEGGRVRRLKPPHFRDAKAAKIFADIAKTNIEKAKEAVFLNHYLMGKELIDLGINVNCAPVADLLFPIAHEIISDRSFGSDPKQVVDLAGAAADGLMAAGVLPIVKHIPGHGRASVDSHEDLPVVSTSLGELQRSDFIPFQKLDHIPFAMTAHIIFEALDPKNPVTLSKKSIDYIRKDIGFKNLIMSDDLSMKALRGSFADRVKMSQGAGCDIMLHCNGDMGEMEEIAKFTNPLPDEKFRRLKNFSLCWNSKKYEELTKKNESDLTNMLS